MRKWVPKQWIFPCFFKEFNVPLLWNRNTFWIFFPPQDPIVSPCGDYPSLFGDHLTRFDSYVQIVSNHRPDHYTVDSCMFFMISGLNMCDTCRLARIHTFIHTFILILTCRHVHIYIYIYLYIYNNYNSTCTCVYTCIDMHIVHIHIQMVLSSTDLYWLWFFSACNKWSFCFRGQRELPEFTRGSH